MQSFWKAIGNFRTKRKSKGKSIGLEKWKSHFMNLLEGEEIEGKEQQKEGTKETSQEKTTIEDNAQNGENDNTHRETAG